MKIYAHVLVKNEENFIWYSISSIINHVDKVLVWDTGSTDKTIDIIKELQNTYPKKIVFKNAQTNKFDEESVRQQMLNETDSDWFIVVDADEIWWEDSIKKVVNLIVDNGTNLESIVVPVTVPIGDIFHKQEDRAGRYKLAGHIGHFALRAINKNIPGLHSSGEHGVWGWVDGDEQMIQDRDPVKIGYIEVPYMHVTHLPRSVGNKDADVVKRKNKLKYEIGNQFPKDFYYPEVFFRPRPAIIESPWKAMGKDFKFISTLETPLRKIKRRVWWGRAGY